MDARSADRAPTYRRTREPAEIAALAGAGALAVAFVLSPDGIEDGPILCPFRLVTGLPCPGCGLTRSWVYLAHGQWTESVAAHPFGLVLVVGVVVLVAAVIRARVTGRRPPDLDRVVRTPVVLAVLVPLIAFAVARVAWLIG